MQTDKFGRAWSTGTIWVMEDWRPSQELSANGNVWGDFDKLLWLKGKDRDKDREVGCISPSN